MRRVFVIVCDVESSTMRQHEAEVDSSATEIIIIILFLFILLQNLF
jgi:hypothetical protein